jgi:L-ribulose-5-phosphate 4-epimerase
MGVNMVDLINEAKEQVILAGKRLVASGLIARTWGNISARVSDTQFVITPSGLAYETLTPEQVVLVNISDCTYEGNIKPSSEKGIHADAYRLRPNVNFIIHTHQEKASVISMEGRDLKVRSEEEQTILGEVIPCAAYGMSSTSMLRESVAAAVHDYSESTAILMKYHGTLCLGKDLENSFDIAQTLEKIAEQRYQKACGKMKMITEKKQVTDYGRSERRGNSFVLECDGQSVTYELYNLPGWAPKVAKLHAKIYLSSKVTNILHQTDEEVVQVSSMGRILRPLIDDLAQIAGVNIKNVKDGLVNRTEVVRKLKYKNAVLLEGEGALCTGITEGDARAVATVLKKGCAADLYCRALKKTNRVGTADAYLQRFVYVMKYSKQKK